MLKTISIIVISVTLFGVVVFILVRNSMKKRIEYYLKLNEKRKKTK
jgi:preprotein translocase subunit YajC|tara:strand:+ start:994 stop:1131 length:138 start_codon:yes stop_codon:yes gene_type:complete